MSEKDDKARAARLARLKELARIAEAPPQAQPKASAPPEKPQGSKAPAALEPVTLEQALAELKAKKAAAAERAVLYEPERKRRAALQAELDALPQHERRAVRDAAGFTQVSAAPRPLEPLRSSGSLAAPEVLISAAPSAPVPGEGSTVEPAPAGAAAGIRHSTKEQQRRDDLWPAIDEARGLAADRNDTADVFAHLSALADRKRAPLLGATEEGLQYLKEGVAAVLTRDALSSRLRRNPR